MCMVCSDSQAALMVLRSSKITSSLVAETMKALKELSVFNSVRLLWIPGHSDILGNETADQFAKQAVIFSVKEWCDFETVARGRSRSLKIASFDRSYTTFYWSVIVSIAVCCTIFELFDVE